MKEKSAPLQTAAGAQPPKNDATLEWKITVDVAQIDFMGPDALFAAGSGGNCNDCGCLISQMPLKKNRRQSI